MRFVTPSAAGKVVSDQIPILIRVPKRLSQGHPVLTLDGQEASVAGVIRRRWWSGKEADYIGAHVNLSEVFTQARPNPRAEIGPS